MIVIEVIAILAILVVVTFVVTYPAELFLEQQLEVERERRWAVEQELEDFKRSCMLCHRASYPRCGRCGHSRRTLT